jgi:transcription elongation factor/antiterminator RfaH
MLQARRAISHVRCRAGDLWGARLLSDKARSLVLTGNERWFVAYSLPKSEFRAQTHLRAQGFRTFLPQILKTVRHARQLRTVRAALFPRYLFIILDLERDRFLSVQSTVGVASLFGFEGRPIPVPAGIVESLIVQTGQSNLIRLDADLSEGERVRILSGPFADLIGALKRLDEKGRAQILLEIMGSSVPVTVPRAALCKVA